MTRIRIAASELESEIEVEVAPGEALLIGRAPDPNSLDWTALVLPQAPYALMNVRIAQANYRLETLALPSALLSANHLLVLGDGALISVFDLGSRNGSFIRLDPQYPMVGTAGQSLQFCLASAAPFMSPPARPRDARWAREVDFCAAVQKALVAWLQELSAPVQVILHAPGSQSDGFLLADDNILELQVHGTLQFPGSTLLDMVNDYIHDQNARFLQLRRRAADMVAASPAIQQILARTAEAAATGRRTLLLGPTGVGKELLARSYHRYSPRSEGPFVTVNCALLEKELLYAQLFGARRGSFTGAVTDLAGLIEAAHGGTLFLDELGEMSLEVQKALLRFLDSRGEYYRLGDPKPRRSEVQLVCASNVPLDEPGHRSGRFRDDLWYRLAACVLNIPPLAARPQDVREFLDSRLLRGSIWSVADCLTTEALELVLQDPWPGNFRDLENFVDRLPVAARPRSIGRDKCAEALREGRPPATPAPAAEAPALLLSATSPVAPAPITASPPPAPERPAPSEPAPPPLSRLRADAASPSNGELGWNRIVNTALGAFLEDQGEKPAGWDQLQLFVERYLKPMFVAQAAAPAQAASGARAPSYAALARRLNIGDGSTVKTHLLRFEERFAQPAGAKSS